MKKLALLFLLVLVASCNEPEARRPVKVKSASFIKETAERTKRLLAQEVRAINDIIAKDTLNDYLESTDGFWYHYVQQNSETNYHPKINDIVTLQYNLMTLSNNTIYSSEEIGTLNYAVDKQELFQGLRQAVKLLKENEIATFIFPSLVAYGYSGDNKRIGTNVPIKSTISIIKIEQQQKDSIQN